MIRPSRYPSRRNRNQTTSIIHPPISDAKNELHHKWSKNISSCCSAKRNLTPRTQDQQSRKKWAQKHFEIIFNSSNISRLKRRNTETRIDLAFSDVVVAILNGGCPKKRKRRFKGLEVGWQVYLAFTSETELRRSERNSATKSRHERTALLIK